MRILTVSHFYEDHGGGIERVAGQLCRQFNNLGMTAVWAASDDDDPPDGIEAIPLRCINPTEKLTGLPMPVPGIKGYRALARAVAQSDAVIVHDALYATSILAMFLAKRLRRRVILIQHIADIPFSSQVLRTLMKAANKLVTGPMLRAAGARVFISETVRHDLLGDPPRLTSELLFNGVDATIFRVEASGSPKATDGVPLIGAKRRVLFVGRYVQKKGLAVLRQLAKLRPEIEFVLAGAGPMTPKDWGLHNVHDLGLQTREDLAELYRRADLLILPSVGEGYPLVIQEAMACGLPVVCGTPADRADPGASSWLRGVDVDLSRPDESAQRCADAIDDFRLSSEERAKMARYAVRQYDWPKMAQRLITLASAP